MGKEGVRKGRGLAKIPKVINPQPGKPWLEKPGASRT